MTEIKMSNKILFAIFSILLIFFTTSYAFATNYYVNGATGSDSYNGLYETYQGGSNGPWKTLGKANTTVTSGTHTINVAAGKYIESITDSKNGTNSSNFRYWLASGTVNIITFKATGNYIKIEGFTAAAVDSGNWNGTIDLEGTGDVVESCNVVNSSRIGIRCGLTSSHCIVNNCVIYNAKSSGIKVVGYYNIITNNDISRTQVGTLSDANGINVDAVSGYSFTGHIIRGNYIHDILLSDNPSNPHIDGIQAGAAGTTAVTNVIVERNHIYLWEDSVPSIGNHAMMLNSAESWIIKNNIFEGYGGIHSSPNGTREAKALKIYNNTIRSNLNWTGTFSSNGINLSGQSGYGINHEIKNNIIVDYTKPSASKRHIYIHDGATYTGSNNVLWNSDGATCSHTGYTLQAGDLHETDPVFVKNFTDLHLQSSSPAKDAGAVLSASGVTNDYAGTSRPQGARYDIGAFELSVQTSQLQSPQNLRVIY